MHFNSYYKGTTILPHSHTLFATIVDEKPCEKCSRKPLPDFREHFA